VFPKFVSEREKRSNCSKVEHPGTEKKCSNVASSTLRMQIKEMKTGSKQVFSSSKSKVTNRSLSVLHATTATNDGGTHDYVHNAVATTATTATGATGATGATNLDDPVKESSNNNVALRSCYNCKKFDQNTNYCSGFNFKLPEPAKLYRCLRFVGKTNVVDLYQQVIKEGIWLTHSGAKLTIQDMKTWEQKDTIVCYKEELILLLKVREKLVCIDCDIDDVMDWYKDDLPQIDEMSLEELQTHVEDYQKHRIHYRG